MATGIAWLEPEMPSLSMCAECSHRRDGGVCAAYPNDDDDDDFILLTHQIKSCHQHVSLSFAQNGVDAIKKLTDGLRPHLILVDVHMPVMNGYEFLTWLMNSPTYRRIPVVFWKGDISDEEATRYYEEGANALVLKPTALQSVESFCKYWFEVVHLPQLVSKE